MTVSIIIPVYNVAPYIEDCLSSVMSQSYDGSMECLIVDDCGTDDSIVIAQNLLASYEGPIQFRIIHHEHNRGLSAARNTGTDEAVGEYLYYLDSDDVITPDCIEKMMRMVMEHPDVEMVQGNACRYLLHGKEVLAVQDSSMVFTDKNEQVRVCYYQTKQIYVNVWNKLLKKDFVIANSLYCVEGLLYEDNLWIFYLIKYLKRAVLLPDILYMQKKRPSSITVSLGGEAMVRSFITIYREILTHLTPGYEKEEYAYYANNIANSYFPFVRKVAQFDEVLQLCRQIGRCFGHWRLRLRLAYYSFLGKFKYGWLIRDLLYRFSHPSLIPGDIKRVWRKRIVRLFKRENNHTLR